MSNASTKTPAPPPYMRKPNIPAPDITLEFGQASGHFFWHWVDKGRAYYLYEDGDLYVLGKHYAASDTGARAEKYESACKWIEALYALGEENSLQE